MTRTATALFLLALTILLASALTMAISLISALVRSPYAYHWYMGVCVLVLLAAWRGQRRG